MKKILLIGDSVRKGYDAYVKERMSKAAYVYYPEENSMFTQYILRNLHCWTDDLELRELDAIHWNAGLWDTLRIYGDEPLTDIKTYEKNIERIIKRMKLLFPTAKIIFATSTPVIEDGYIKNFEFRYNRDIENYNSIACKAAKKCGVTVNDLYSLLKEKPESLHSDQTHFYTADATELIGDAVVNTLCQELGIDKALLAFADKEKYAITTVRGDKELYVKRGNIYEKVRGI